jgi:hypothetical protein
LTAKVAVQRLALDARMPMMAEAHDASHRPDIRLHPISINATIVYFFADIREESIYAS